MKFDKIMEIIEELKVKHELSETPATTMREVEDLFSVMADFIWELDEDDVPDNLIDVYYEIVDYLTDEDSDDFYDNDEDDEYDESVELDDDDIVELKEAISKRRVKINVASKLAHKKYYRMNRAKIKRKQKMIRLKPKFKRWKMKTKRMSKLGKTASGKRKQKYY